MSVEKKARVVISPPQATALPVGASACQRVWHISGLEECIVEFLWVDEMLQLRRVSKYRRQAVDCYWDRGLPKRLIEQAMRMTKLPREFFDRLFAAEGAIANLLLLQLMLPLSKEYIEGGLYPHSHHFLLPDLQLFKRHPDSDWAGEHSGVDCNPLLDSRTRLRLARVHEPRFMGGQLQAVQGVRQENWLKADLCQMATDFNCATPRHEVVRLVTANKFGYVGVECPLAQYVLEQSVVPWEKCLFDGKRLRIHDVECLLSRKGKYRERTFDNPKLLHMERLADELRQTEIAWTELGFALEKPPIPPRPRRLPGYNQQDALDWLDRLMQSEMSEVHVVP